MFFKKILDRVNLRGCPPGNIVLRPMDLPLHANDVFYPTLVALIWAMSQNRGFDTICSSSSSRRPIMDHCTPNGRWRDHSKPIVIHCRDPIGGQQRPRRLLGRERGPPEVYRGLPEAFEGLLEAYCGLLEAFGGPLEGIGGLLEAYWGHKEAHRRSMEAYRRKWGPIGGLWWPIGSL